MEAVFLKVLDMSAAASWLILIVAALHLVLKRTPKWVNCLLWGLAGLRLVCAFSIESAMSLIPSKNLLDTGAIRFEAAPADVSAAVIGAAQPALSAALPRSGAESIRPLHSWIAAAGVIWVLGMAALLVYAAVSYLRVRKSVRVSMPMEGNIRLCDHIRSPFILGMIRPVIYIPSALNQTDIPPVIAHEKAHISRGDHLWKPLGYAILTLHWFNPLCWLAYILLCRDIELACDEKVIRSMDIRDRKIYSSALLECSIRTHSISACPLAFGEVGVKQRVRSVLRYRKPAVWVTAVSMFLCAVLACCFLTNPIQAEGTVPAGQDSVSALQTVNTNANLRESPSQKSPAIAMLPEGAVVTVHRVVTVGERDWANVSYADEDVTGWVVAELLSDAAEVAAPADILPAAPAEQPKAPDVGDVFSVSSPAELRSAPSMQARVIATLEPGTELTVLSVENIAEKTWVYAQYQAQHDPDQVLALGWIRTDLLSSSTEAANEKQSEVFRVGGSAFAAAALELRSAPSMQARTVTNLEPGTELTILQIETVAEKHWIYGLYTQENDLGEAQPITGWAMAEMLDGVFDEAAVIPIVPAEQPDNAAVTILRPVEIRSAPTEAAAVIGTIDAGMPMDVLRSVNIGDKVWYEVESSIGPGWATDLPGAEAMLFFRDYTAALQLSTPDQAEKFIGFRSDAERRFFHENYVPRIEGWNLIYFLCLNDDLWCICHSPETFVLDYLFIGRVDGQLYIFQSVEQLPDALSNGLNKSSYERRDTINPVGEYYDAVFIIQELAAFSDPVKVTVEGPAPAQVSDLSFWDMVTSADSWRYANHFPEDADGTTTILLYAEDGSTASLNSGRGTILVCRADGIRVVYSSGMSGERMVSMIYPWAVARSD